MTVDWRKAAAYIAGLVVSSLGFIVLNLVYGVLHGYCADCHAHIGFPFAYMDAGGWEGNGGLLWHGALADLLILIASSVLLGRWLDGYRFGKRS